MSQRLPATPAPGPLEEYCAHFDPLFGRLNQREGFRRYLEGLLLPQERSKTLTALANAEPIVGAQNPSVQSLQWFVSESDWDQEALNTRRLALLQEEPQTAPDSQGVLVIDETGDRKAGTKTAHVGRQYLANVGKVDNGVVSVTSLWADARIYYPLSFEPYTPAHWFPKGKSDPTFRTKPQIALELVGKALQSGVPFRAVVADSVYGENEAFRCGLDKGKVGYVLALKPSHAWWHQEGTLGSLGEAAQAAAWKGAQQPGDWSKVVRTFRDEHQEDWWVLEVAAGPYGPDKALRGVIATSDPQHLPDSSTWYLVTNLAVPGSQRAKESELAPADLAEIVGLYGLRLWVEQSYKQVKHSLGWAQYQVRSDRAMRRHWQLVCCAFSFCWWYQSHAPEEKRVSGVAAEVLIQDSAGSKEAGREKKGDRAKRLPPPGVLAGGAAGSAGLAGALGPAVALLAGVVGSAPATGVGAAA